MSTLTIDRSDLTGQELTELLRSRLGTSYNVLPGMRTSRKPFAKPRPGSTDTIAVGKGSNRLFSVHVTIIRRAGRTELAITPGGLGWETAVNSLQLGRKVRRVLSTLPGAAAAR
jgi:hypothetical protein